MKVYIVFKMDGYNTIIDCIFDTLEKALEYTSDINNRNTWWEAYEVA